MPQPTPRPEDAAPLCAPDCPGDPAALAAAVRALPGLEAAADPAAMRAEALDRFGEEKNYAQLLAIYRRMLAGDEGADS